MRILKSLWIAHFIAAALFVAVAQAEIGDFDTPLPITSNDLERWMKIAGVQPSERPQVEAAFDAYVEGWQKLRDQTLRPLSIRVAQLRRQQMYPVEDYDAMEKMSPEQRSQLEAANESEHEAALRNTANAEVELHSKMSAAYKRLAQLETPFFEALRAGEHTPVQRAAIDREALRRTRHRLHSLLLACNRNFPSSRIGTEVLSVPAQKLDADTAAKISERLQAYERQATPLLERIAVQSLNEPEDPNHPQIPSKEFVEFAQAQMRTIKDIAAAMPKDAADAWLPKARARLVYAVLASIPMTPRVEVIKAVGERSNPKVVARIEQWDHERAALEDQIVETLGSGPSWETLNQCSELDKAALGELAQLSGTPALNQLAYTTWPYQLNDPDATDEFVDISGAKKYEAEGTQRGRQLAERQVSEDAQPQETPQQFNDRRARVRTLNAADVQSVRDRLGVTPARQAVWEALAEDLLADTRAYAEQFHQGYDNRDRKPDAPRDSVIIPLAREQRMQQARREEQWFDDLATTIPEVPAQALAVERARRACARERTMAGSALHRTQGRGNRWLDVDLDQAVESLKIASPAGASGVVSDTLTAWRAQKLLDLQALVLSNEAHMVSSEAAWRKLRETHADREMFLKLREAETDYDRDQNALCKRAAEAQEGFIQAIASALTPERASAFRVVLRRQMYPEVYRSLGRADQEIDRVRAAKDASPEQIAALSSLAESFHQRFEQIADRTIKQLDACDELWKDPALQRQTLNYPPFNEVRLAILFAELTNCDLQYDRDELVARTLRRLRDIGVTGSIE